MTDDLSKYKALETENAKLREALINSRDALVYMRRVGSIAIAGFVRRNPTGRDDVVKMLDKLDDAIVSVCAALGKGESDGH